MHARLVNIGLQVVRKKGSHTHVHVLWPRFFLPQSSGALSRVRGRPWAFTMALVISWSRVRCGDQCGEGTRPPRLRPRPGSRRVRQASRPCVGQGRRHVERDASHLVCLRGCDVAKGIQRPFALAAGRTQCAAALTPTGSGCPMDPLSMHI